jgi:hypothetical protein
LRKLVAREWRKLARLIEQEPSTVIVEGEEGGAGEATVGEVLSWLFRRRANDDRDSGDDRQGDA